MSKFTAFTIKNNGLLREIHTDIKVSIPFPPDVNIATDDQRLIDCKALWDTGATNTAITKSLAAKMGLKPVSVAQSHHAQGVSIVNVYLVHIYLPNMIAMSSVFVSEIADTVGAFDVLIGMDIITIGDFSITNVGGNTCVSFRTPSTKEVDFVEQKRLDEIPIKELLKSKRLQGQNELCNCGSGKQFKRCHGRT